MARKKKPGDSPYEDGGAGPDKTMPGDFKKKSGGSVAPTAKATDWSGITIKAADASSWLPSNSNNMLQQINKYMLQLNSRTYYSGGTFSFSTGPDTRETEFASLGFAAGVVRGVRSFAVDDLGRLTGVSFRKVWTPGENQAKCYADNRKEFGDFGAHLPECVCGFYAYYDGSNDYRSSGETITAVVEGWGSTVIGSRGFRCSKAKIVALHIPDSVKRSGVVSRNYSEIPQFDSFLRMIQEFPPIGDEKTSQPTDEDFWTREA